MFNGDSLTFKRANDAKGGKSAAHALRPAFWDIIPYTKQHRALIYLSFPLMRLDFILMGGKRLGFSVL